jgi:hypothetical protein
VAAHGADQADEQEDRADETWKPWKPVAMKKVRRRCCRRKPKPRGCIRGLHESVKQHAEQHRERQAPDEALAVVLMQQRVVRPGDTVVPEVSRISVLISGRCQGSNSLDALRRPDAIGPATRAVGPIGTGGSKKAQNQATKNITSEAMNRIMP